jgi:hypothetical protein
LCRGGRSIQVAQKAEENILSNVRRLKRRLPSPSGSDPGNYAIIYLMAVTVSRSKVARETKGQV